MRLRFKPLLALLIAVPAFFFLNASKKTKKTPPADTDQKIQVAILLDVSNSMDGLIDQAKVQLWNMVNTLGQVQCSNSKPPKIEIALYEYGTPRNKQEDGYIKQINNFITNLDSLSENLFSLTTNGGDEYCGHVIYRSLTELNWDTNPNSYKVIFIAGNESFRQGTVPYTKACSLSKSKGVIVNTIYCGDKMDGIREFWNLQGECGNGSFSTINQNQKIDDIATPYDSVIIALNTKLNDTYITYGSFGQAYYNKQKQMDAANASVSKKAAIKRTEAKSNAGLYNNANWDLVDKSKEGDAVFEKIDFKTLPDSLQNKTKEQLKVIVLEKRKERAAIQQQIITANQQREQYIVDQKNKNAQNSSEATLETEIERIIKEQVKRFEMTVKQ